MTVLYREMGAVSKVPVGEFRKVSWCKRHNYLVDDGDCRFGEPLTTCEFVEVWMEVV